ncbi:hypothetical protein ABT129_33165, partial [Streptomyces sp. NPDC002057]
MSSRHIASGSSISADRTDRTDRTDRPARDAAEAALVENYPGLVRLAYLVLPPALGRHRRVLTAHGLVQKALAESGGRRGRSEPARTVAGAGAGNATRAEVETETRSGAGVGSDAESSSESEPAESHSQPVSGSRSEPAESPYGFGAPGASGEVRRPGPGPPAAPPPQPPGTLRLQESLHAQA